MAEHDDGLRALLLQNDEDTRAANEIEEVLPIEEQAGTNDAVPQNSEKSRSLERLPSLRPTSFLEPLLNKLAATQSGRQDIENSHFLGGWRRIGTSAFRRRASMALICFMVLVGDANRGLVLPTLQEYIGIYGGNASVLGLANAGFSAGRLLAAPLYGYWMDERNTGEVVLFSMILCFVCNLIYALASKMPHPDIVIVVSRTVLGFGASILGVGRAYIAKQTSKAERGPYIAILCALQYAGFTLTAFISVFDFEGIGKLSLTKYNLPGYVLSVSYMLGIIALCVVPNSLFDSAAEHTTNRRRLLRSSKYNNSSYPYLLQLEKEDNQRSAGEGSTTQNGRNDKEEIKIEEKLPSQDSPSSGMLEKTKSLKSLLRVPKIVVVFILLNFTVRAVLATLETLSTYIISYLYTGSSDPKVWQLDGAPFEVALTFTFIGIGGLVVFIGVFFVSKYVQDRITLVLGLSFILLGLGLTLDPKDGRGLRDEMSLIRFQAGLALVWGLGYPLSQTVVVSALSKVLSSEQQGIWMGNLASAGSAGRIVAPTVAGYIYHRFQEHTGLIPLASCCGLTALSILLVTSLWKKLQIVSTD